MHIISSCIILFMMILNILCQGEINNDWNISFTPAEVTAVSGLCAYISCTFSYPNGAVLQNLLLCKDRNQCNEAQAVKKTKYKMLEPDLNKKNCSIIINNIEAKDKGEYKIRVEGVQSYTHNRIFKIIIEDTPVIIIPPLREGHEANLSCSVPFPCPETPPEITWWIKKKRGNFTELKENITLTAFKSFSTLTFMPTSDLHKATVKCEPTYKENKTIKNRMTIEVMYVTLRIQGNKTVNEGDTLSLNCTVDSHPPSSHPVWSFNRDTEKLKSHISAESLTITNVSKLHAGEYVCAVTYMKETLNRSININVIRHALQDVAEDQNMTGKNKEPRNVTRHTKGCDSLLNNFAWCAIFTFLAGMASSAVLFSVVLCCQEKHKRDTTYEVMDTKTETTVILEVYEDERPEKKWK